MQRFVNPKLFATNRHDAREIFICKRLERSKQRSPSRVPLFEQLRSSDVMTGLKLRIAMPPWLLPIRVQEIAEPRFEITGDVPDDDRSGIPVAGPALPQFVISP